MPRMKCNVWTGQRLQMVDLLDWKGEHLLFSSVLFCFITDAAFSCRIERIRPYAHFFLNWTRTFLNGYWYSFCFHGSSIRISYQSKVSALFDPIHGIFAMAFQCSISLSFTIYQCAEQFAHCDEITREVTMWLQFIQMPRCPWNLKSLWYVKTK